MQIRSFKYNSLLLPRHDAIRCFLRDKDGELAICGNDTIGELPVYLFHDDIGGIGAYAPIAAPGNSEENHFLVAQDENRLRAAVNHSLDGLSCVDALRLFGDESTNVQLGVPDGYVILAAMPDGDHVWFDGLPVRKPMPASLAVAV